MEVLWQVTLSMQGKRTIDKMVNAKIPWTHYKPRNLTLSNPRPHLQIHSITHLVNLKYSLNNYSEVLKQWQVSIINVTNNESMMHLHTFQNHPQVMLLHLSINKPFWWTYIYICLHIEQPPRDTSVLTNKTMTQQICV